MKTSKTLILLLSLLLAVAFIGCEGEQGPEGPEGPTGPKGDPGDPAVTVEYTFLGNGGQDCAHCHQSTVNAWETTGHVHAYDNLAPADRDRPYCLQCHTTGWDSPVSFADTEITTYGPDLYGYDDYFGDDTEEGEMRRHALAGVQCEACHGPMGPEFNAHRPLMSFSTHNDTDTGESTSLCAQCHGGQLTEWLESGHGLAGGTTVEGFNAQHYAHNATCAVCHTSEGFILNNDPRYATYEFPHEVSQIGCVTCHDPHSGGNEHQLRALGAVSVSYFEDELDVPSMSGFGTGQLCAQCHHARGDYASIQGQIDVGAGRVGPHHSNQMDLFIGHGSYEIEGYTYDRLAGFSHNNVTNACVGCHMTRDAEMHGSVEEHAFHTFAPEAGSCTSCHTTMTDIESFRADMTAEIEGKLDQIAVLCGYTDYHAFEAAWNADNRSKERWQREIGYAAIYVLSDGSMGIHNPTYANSLLDNAIEHGNAQVAR